MQPIADATISSTMGSKSTSNEVIEVSNSNPTRQQRAVYSWHEKRNSDAAIDIFSTEWFKRTKSFLEKQSSPDSPDIKLEDVEKVEDLEFGAFFIEHPIAAFALWQFLQACYTLDRIVCINPLAYEDSRRADETKLQGWEKLPPFQYLNASTSKDGKIRKKWIESMGQLKKEIESGALEGDMLVSRLYDMYTGIDRLQSSMSGLRLGFDESLKGLKFRREMLERAAKVVQERLKIISLVLNLDENKAISTQEDANTDSGAAQQDPLPKDVSGNREERSTSPVSSSRLRKSNKRQRKSQGASPEMVDSTSNSAVAQGLGRRGEKTISAVPKYLLISLSATVALFLAIFLLYITEALISSNGGSDLDF